MGIAPISFKSWVTIDRDTLKNDHERLNKVAQLYTTGSNADDAFVKNAHDVLDITPWGCSEGDTIKSADRKISDKFIDTMKENFKNGNKNLAYALGRMVGLSRAGRANNCGFADLPLGKIEGLNYIIHDESIDYCTAQGKAVPKEEYKEVKQTMDGIIYHHNPF